MTEHSAESGAPSTTGPMPVRMNHEHGTGGVLGCATCSPVVLCRRADLSGKYACNLAAGHDGAHMELTDRHSAAWDLFRSPATRVLPPGKPEVTP